MTEQRYWVVLEVLAGVPVTEVAERYGVSRQSVHAWLRRYRSEGPPGLADRSHRVHAHPWQIPAEVESAVCELRREHPRWGPLRLVHELARAGGSPVPSRMSAYRVLVRHGLVDPRPRKRPKGSYRRWERDGSLGFSVNIAQAQWAALGQICALTGRVPERLAHADLDAARDELLAAADRYGHGSRHDLSAIFGLEATLFHAGVTDELPRKRGRTKADARAAAWAKVPPVMRATMQDYLAQLATTLRPGRVVNVEATLREFAGFVAGRDPGARCVADLGRRHVEDYKLWLAHRPAARGGPLHRHTIKDRLCALRGFFTRLIEWDVPDAPARVPVLPSDFPIADEPLPRFLDDAAATKLLQAARADDDPFVRLTVEFLARTGLRKGEYLALTTDAVVQIGSAYWLHVPVGKLHTDRYIPLHPQLKDLLDAWLARRPEGLRSKLVFVEQGRQIPESRVDAAVAKAATTAGIGRVSPHRLRHTLATQAINRGMSLEAIAALLGHRSLHMTLVYARIADRTVADEYFTVSEKVEALYDAPRQLPAEAEGAEMRKLRAEMHRRMLGNGYCARPVGMDCHFESICESCTFFQTTIEFRPTLQRQRDDAEAKGRKGRAKVFDGLLARLDDQAS